MARDVCEATNPASTSDRPRSESSFTTYWTLMAARSRSLGKKLSAIASKVVKTVRCNVTTDWVRRENAGDFACWSAASYASTVARPTVMSRHRCC